MRSASIKKNDLTFRSAKQDQLLQSLVTLLKESNGFLQSLSDQIQALTHAEEPNVVLLTKEVNRLKSQYQNLSFTLSRLRIPVESKLSELNFRGPLAVTEPILASSLQAVMMLHLASNQTIQKRLDDLLEIQKRRKEFLSQLDMGYKGIQERFNDSAQKLNLLLHMHSCLEKEGSLPGNIMYTDKIPKAVVSPFAPLLSSLKLK